MSFDRTGEHNRITAISEKSGLAAFQNNDSQTGIK